MKVYPADQTTLIIHPGTGTILTADECVLYNTDDTAIWPEEHEVVEAAEANDDTLGGLHIVMMGNVFDGVTPVGPFLNWDDAHSWAEENSDQEWWVASLKSTDSFSEDVL